VGLSMFTTSPGYQMSVHYVEVDPLAMSDSYSVNENNTLTVPPPGVLGNDTGVNGTNLSALLLVPPTYGSVNLATNGSFTYTPAANFAGADYFSYQASDALTNLGAALVTITVNPPPQILSISVHGGVADISWSAIAGRNYMLQYATNLHSLSWSNVPPEITASGTNAQATNNFGASLQRFYRVVLLP
jgi:Bacterial Ig domain